MQQYNKLDSLILLMHEDIIMIRKLCVANYGIIQYHCQLRSPHMHAMK